MRVAVFSTKPYDEQFFAATALGSGHELVFLEPRLTVETARLADGFDAAALRAPIAASLVSGRRGAPSR